MEERPVHIVDTGVANIASLVAALRRLGADSTLTREPRRVEAADFAVLPGVGAFGAGMSMLRAHDLVEPLRERIEAGRPTLAICLGMQLLAEESEESPGVAGLGVLEVGVDRFPDDVRIPQFGWNRIRPDSECALLEPGYAYFANSYRIARDPEGWAHATTDYGGPFISAIERGAVLACQFHPEISGEWGSRLLNRWLEAGADRC